MSKPETESDYQSAGPEAKGPATSTEETKDGRVDVKYLYNINKRPLKIIVTKYKPDKDHPNGSFMIEHEVYLPASGEVPMKYIAAAMKAKIDFYCDTLGMEFLAKRPTDADIAKIPETQLA